MKLALALLAVSSYALAQTPPPPPPATSAKPVTHHAATSAAKSTSALPKVAGLPHTLYSLKYIDTKIGTGPMSEPQKYYTVNYTGYFPDGKKFDSSFDHGDTFTFPYGAHRVIIGWDTGFEGMRVGGKRRLFVPYQLAYGLTGKPPQMPAKANLIFDVELIGFSDKPPTPKTPPAQPTPPPTTPAPGGSAPAAAPATPPAGSAPAATPATPPTPPPTAAPVTPPAPTTPAAPTTPPKPPATF